MSAAQHEHLLLGQCLIDMGEISSDQLAVALTEQKRCGDYLGQILVRLGFVSESVIRNALPGTMGQEQVALQQATADPQALSLIPEDLARRLHVLPLHLSPEQDSVSIAMVDPFDLGVLDELERLLEGRLGVAPVQAEHNDIAEALDRFYGFELSVDGILHEMETGEAAPDAATETGPRSPLVRLVEALLADAVKQQASDIHIEPEQGFVRIRYRLDGVLQQIRCLHRDYCSPLLIRIKVLAALDITETRAPQDGRFSLTLHGRQVDFRVSTLPTVHGENTVLRVLDRRKGIMTLEDLDLDEHIRTLIARIIRRPQGLTLVTGPTGSGKTTTLYAILNELNREQVNIMTLEDPVEYHSRLLRQCSLNELVQLSFASGMRALMRQDPDIILVGEIRDQDTASMALRAAMTGHQVFSTLHSCSALGAIPRLRDIGVRDGILSGNITAILAQRLLRRLCPHCRTDTGPGQRREPCPECAGRGYRGRIALLEGLLISPGLDALIAQHASLPELHALAVQQGLRTLGESGLALVHQHHTSLEELGRVVELDEEVQPS